LPKIIKIDLYNSELYRFKVCAFFETVYKATRIAWHMQSACTTVSVGCYWHQCRPVRTAQQVIIKYRKRPQRVTVNHMGQCRHKSGPLAAGVGC